MTNKRNKSLPCLMVMAAMLLSAFAAGGPQAMDYWTANAERSGVVHAGNGREAVVLCMQGRKVVMQVQVDRAAVSVSSGSGVRVSSAPPILPI